MAMFMQLAPDFQIPLKHWRLFGSFSIHPRWPDHRIGF